MAVIDWNDYEANASCTFMQLWKDTDFTDVTLATADDQQIMAHKAILSSCSEFFKNILKINPHPRPLIYLKDIKYSHLEMIIKFLYMGQCEVAEDELNTFINAGKDLKVKGLIDQAFETNYSSNKIPENNTNSKQEYGVLLGMDSSKEEASTFKSPCDNDMISKDIQENSEKNLNVKGVIGQAFETSNINDKKHEHNELDFDVESKHKSGILIILDSSEAEALTMEIPRNFEMISEDKQESFVHGYSSHDIYKGMTEEPVSGNSKMIECVQCDYKCNRTGQMTRHVKSRHIGVRYDCNQCGSTFSNAKHVLRHKEARHEGIKYPCDVCGKMYAQKSGMTMHRQIHHERTWK